jgi:hypothetical protein
MKVSIIGNMGSATTDTLVSAAHASITETTRLINGIHTTKWFMSGFEFKSYSKLGHHLLNEINTWMADSGLVDIEALRTAERSGGYQMFDIS